MKFEKMMKKLCKDIGVDKRTLLSIFSGDLQNNNIQGKHSDIENSNFKNESGIKD